MADIRKMYLDLISDYTGFESDLDYHKNLSNENMLYSLKVIKENNFDNDLENLENDKPLQSIYNRFCTLISIFESLGIKADSH